MDQFEGRRRSTMPLYMVPVGQWGEVKILLGQGSGHRRLLDLGLIEGTSVEAIRRSPSGDPTAYQIRGAVIALRLEEAAQVIVETVDRI